MRVTHLLRSHLLLATALAYIIGITFSQFLLFSQSALFFLFLTGTAILFFFYKRKESIAAYLLLLFFFQIGILAGNSISSPPENPHHISNIVDQRIEGIIIGKIKRIYSYDGTTTRFDVASLSFRTKKSLYRHTQGTIRFTLKAKLPPSFLPGTIIAIRAKLGHPSRYNNQGSFDYPNHLALKDIWITGFISSPLHIHKVESDISFVDKLTAISETQREKIKQFFDSHLSKDSAALYKALITGDKSSLSLDVLEQFKGAGCMHILAISGIHMSLLGLFSFSLIYWLLRRSTWLILTINTKKAAAIASIIPLVLYSLVAGAQPPVVRSLIMSLIVIIAICSERKQSFFTLVALAAFSILVFSPADLFTISFQLSFVAILSITSIIPLITAICTPKADPQNEFSFTQRSRTWFFSAIAVSLAATLGTAPLLLFYFNRLSLVGPLANLVVEPLICIWSLTIGFIATVFIYLFPPVAVFLFKFGAIGLLLATKAVYFFNSFSFSSVRLPTPSLIQLCLYYLCCISITQYQQLSKSVCFFSLTSLILSLLLFWLPPAEISKYSKKHSTLSILDVGHGSAAIIEFPHGKRILIDGGAISSPKFNIGERVIATFLWKKGITTIDEIVVTHPDSDHYNGIPFIMKHFGVKKLWINGTREDDLSWQNVLELAKENEISVQVAPSNANIMCSGNACVQVLANTVENSGKNESMSKNEESLVIKFTHGNFSAIFPGDITKNIEEKLIMSKLNLQATLLLAAHHGSSTSNSRSFLVNVSPDYLAVSASPYKPETFPSSYLLSLCKELGITMLQTAKSGTISITSTGENYTLDTFLPH